MKRLFLILTASALLGGTVAAEEKPSSWTNEDGELVFAADSGPDKIDVSEYPKEMQKAYKIANRKCSKCHTFARPVNCDFVLEHEWRDYVLKMKKKKRSGVRKKDVKVISDFFIFDSKIRKKELYEKNLKAFHKKEEKASKKDDGDAGSAKGESEDGSK